LLGRFNAVQALRLAQRSVGDSCVWDVTVSMGWCQATFQRNVVSFLSTVHRLGQI